LGAVADIGCGTGLVGALLRPHVRRLVGADLSSAMLDCARRRCVYDELTQMDLLAFLRDATASFDAVVAADVLCYFGVLDDVAAAVVGALRPGGVFAFTVESQAEADPGEWSLGMTGRYAHSPGYVATVMADFDDVTIRHCSLRMEAGLPVDGLLVTGRHR
jgi:predicted TPR repeat methyltransferase